MSTHGLLAHLHLDQREEIGVLGGKADFPDHGLNVRQ